MKNTNKNQFNCVEIELYLLHEAAGEKQRRTTKQHFNRSDLLDWKKDTFHVTFKYFIDDINIQLSFWPSSEPVILLTLKFAAVFCRYLNLMREHRRKTRINIQESDGIKRLKSFESYLIV